MSFNKGDRVRVIYSGSWSSAPKIGLQGEVSGWRSSFEVDVLWDDGHSEWMNVDWIDKIETPLRFKVGDKVDYTCDHCKSVTQGIVSLDDGDELDNCPYNVDCMGCGYGHHYYHHSDLTASMNMGTNLKEAVKNAEIKHFAEPKIIIPSELTGSLQAMGRDDRRDIWTTVDTSKLETIKEGINMLKTIPNRIKKLLNKGLRAQYQLGWIDETLEITARGQEELLELLYEDNKEAFGKRAVERIAEIKKEEEEAKDV